MIKKMLLLLLVTVVGLTACNHTEPDVGPVRRTLLVYIEGRNNLSSAADADLAEMRAAEIPADCRLIVYRSVRGDSVPTLQEIKEGKSKELVSYEAGAMATDPEQMSRVLADVKRLAPSTELGLVLWSHSSGWRQKARGYGLENSWKIMSITALAQTLEGEGLDFVFFDSCFMGSVEVAYELRQVAPRMVASMCEVPTDGMPYTETLPQLFNVDIDSGLKAAIDLTVDHYTATPGSYCPSTLSLIDLTLMDALADSVKKVIANELPADFKPQRLALASAYSDWYYMFFDLGQYVEALGGDTTLLKRAVLHEKHTPYKIWGTLPLEHCSGLSVGIPDMAPSKYERYDYYSLEWAKFLNIQNGRENIY